MTLPRGTALELLGRSGSWYRVRVPPTGVEGYVHATMVERTGTGPAPSPEVPRAVRVTASRADVRAGPTEKSDVLATLERGEVLEWLERRGQWHRVRDLARPLEGYVHASIEAAIKRFATDVPPAGRDPFTGHGAINPRGTLLGLSLAR